MRLASTNRVLVATILFVAVLFGALAIVCADGLHVPTAGGIDAACAGMSHSSALVATAGTGSPGAATSMLAIALAGLATMLATKSMRPVTSDSATRLGRSAGSLNGRLRL
jgi:hypothetical protein